MVVFFAIVPPANPFHCPPGPYERVSMVGPIYGISVAAVYQLENGSIAKVKGSGGVTPSDASKRDLYKEAKFAEGWYKNITSDMFG